MKRRLGFWLKYASGLSAILLLSVFSYIGDELRLPFLPLGIALGAIYLTGDWLTDRAGGTSAQELSDQPPR